MTFHKYTVLLEKRLHIKEKSSLLYHFITVYLSKAVNLYHSILGSTFHKYTVIKWWSEDDFSLICNLFSRSTVYLWKVIIIYHIILGSTLYLWTVIYANHITLLDHCIFMRCRLHLPCFHLPFYHVWLRWRKSYNSFYDPNRPWIKSPPLQIFCLFLRTAT